MSHSENYIHIFTTVGIQSVKIFIQSKQYIGQVNEKNLKYLSFKGKYDI